MYIHIQERRFGSDNPEERAVRGAGRAHVVFADRGRHRVPARSGRGAQRPETGERVAQPSEPGESGRFRAGELLPGHDEQQPRTVVHAMRHADVHAARGVERHRRIQRHVFRHLVDG